MKAKRQFKDRFKEISELPPCIFVYNVPEDADENTLLYYFESKKAGEVNVLEDGILIDEANRQAVIYMKSYDGKYMNIKICQRNSRPNKSQEI